MSDYYAVSNQNVIMALTVVDKILHDDGVIELTTELTNKEHTQHDYWHHKAYCKKLFILENEEPYGCVFHTYNEAKDYCIKILTNSIYYKKEEIYNLVIKLDAIKKANE